MAANFRHKGVIDQRRDDVNRINDMTVKVTRVTGRFLVVGTGEVAVDLPFPVVFSERPNFGHGAELDEAFSAVAGTYPTGTATVVGWTRQDPDVSEFRYTGCRLAIVTTGASGQQMWIHYAFEGKAMRNPLSQFDSLESPL